MREGEGESTSQSNLAAPASATVTRAVSADGGRASDLPIPPDIAPEKTLTKAQWGMIAFLLSEVALFSTLIVTYLSFLGKSTVPPTPAEALSLGLVLCTTACLLASSGTIHLAERALRAGGEESFRTWWAITIALGVTFLLGTAYEWYGLITEHGLTISRNVFGSTYYTLVGFHAGHVSAGVIVMSLVLVLVLRRQVTAANHAGVELVSWYWHFVDGVWIVVFTVVYVAGR
jgi:cytochrome c oxidase subunit 3/cytochrome o ubiquinol oxidase subunit 3